MAQFLKQSTAFTFRIGPFVDSTDGVTAETGLTIGQADIQISKAGGAFAQTSASPTTTHDADGWYQCPLTTTDTGTLGTLTVQVVMAGALPVWKDFMVLPANVYDSLVAGSDVLNADVTYWNGSVLTGKTGALLEFGIVDSGTAQSATATTLVGRAAAVDDSIQPGMTLMAYGSTQGYWQSVLIDSVATDTYTIAAWPLATPSGTITYQILGTPRSSVTIPPAVNLTQWNGTAVATPDTAGYPKVTIKDGTGAGEIALTSGAIDTVAAVTTVNGLAANVITAAATAADFTTEIQSGLATAAALATVDDFLDTEVAAILAAVDTEVAAIKAKTDSLTFTVAGQVDANIQSINDVTITGNGGTGTEFSV